MNRYFVDKRGGCIAVRERAYTDPEYNGLHGDTPGVVRYWHGTQEFSTCPECGHKRSAGWTVADKDIAAAKALCEELNIPDQRNEEREQALKINQYKD